MYYECKIVYSILSIFVYHKFLSVKFGRYTHFVYTVLLQTVTKSKEMIFCPVTLPLKSEGGIFSLLDQRRYFSH